MTRLACVDRTLHHTETPTWTFDTAPEPENQFYIRTFNHAETLQNQGHQNTLIHTIELYLQTLSQIKRPCLPEAWASRQYHLGNALSVLGEKKPETLHLENAIAAYGEALKEYTLDRKPSEWAMTQNNLGNALSILGGRTHNTQHLEEAVAVYRAVLQQRKRNPVPFDWAATQNNLGNALCLLGLRTHNKQRLKAALKAVEQAWDIFQTLKMLQYDVYFPNIINQIKAFVEPENLCPSPPILLEQLTAKQEPIITTELPLQTSDDDKLFCEAAMHVERGAACMAQQNHAQAAEHYKKAAELLPNEVLEHGNAFYFYLFNHAYVLRQRGEEQDNYEALKQSIQIYRQLLLHTDRQDFPDAWASVQNGLGNALSNLGEKLFRPQNLEEAIMAYQHALEETPRELLPLQWATTQHNMGMTLYCLGEIEGGTPRLEEAITMYRKVLEERTPDRTPVEWAITQYHLGKALYLLGSRTDNPQDVSAGLEAMRLGCTSNHHTRG